MSHIWVKVDLRVLRVLCHTSANIYIVHTIKHLLYISFPILSLDIWYQITLIIITTHYLKKVQK